MTDATAPPFRVGLTGNIAAGKSTVADLWRRRGAAVVDADELARRAVAPGSEGLRRVVEAFGADVLDGDGALDRAALGRRVFADDGARARLEAIVHPEVARLRPAAEREALADARAAGRQEPAGGRAAEREAPAGAHVAGGPRPRAIVVHDVPLLFEVGLEGQFDLVVHVHAPADARRARLIEGRGMAPGEAAARIAAQMPSEEKIPLADVVIDNSADLDALGAAADAAWERILEAAGARPARPSGGNRG